MVLRSDIPDLLSGKEFTTAVNEWTEFKTYGLPYEGGAKDQPCQWFDVIKMFDMLYVKHGGNNGGN